MRLVTYQLEYKTKLGVLNRDGDWIYPLASLGIDYVDMQDLIEHMSESEMQLAEHVSAMDNSRIQGAAPLSEVKLLAPIPYPRQDVI